MSELLSSDNLIGLLMLTSLEVVLGIDNIVFLAIVTSRLPQELRSKARRVGLFLAMIMRVLLLLSISWIASLTEPFFTVFSTPVSGRSLILILGGLFLMGKATFEIHEKITHMGSPETSPHGSSQFIKTMIQVMLLDLVFSLDSVITAVGMVQNITVMVLAIVVAVVIMMIFANPVSDFIERHPTIKVLALSFLVLIGFVLTAEGTGRHIEKGYIYFAMAFSLGVEFLNIRLRNPNKKVSH